MKKQKGITLIALIITIIVMLILVGVTVTTAINGGLFEKARIGAKGTQKEVDREKLNMAVAFAYDETTGKIDKTKLEQELGDEWRVTETTGTYLCENKKTGNKFKVTAGGEITDEEIENEDKLIINCKIVETNLEGETGKRIFFIPQSGFDYQKEFCEFASKETKVTINSVEDGWEKIAEQGEITPGEMVKALNSDWGLTGENELSIDEWTRLYALMNKLQNNKATIKFNGKNVGDDEAPAFATAFESEDTKLERTPIKVTVTVTENGEEKITETGHKAEDDPEEVVKVDLKKRKINSVEIKFRYSIRITNEGEIAGAATEISDYIPDGLKFVQEDNPDWRESEGKVVTNKLAGTTLQPGESAEVEIILTWINSDKNMGVMMNTAEINKDHNKYDSRDIDSTPGNKDLEEDDLGQKAQILLTVKTGSDFINYSILGVMFISIILTGAILIKGKLV